MGRHAIWRDFVRLDRNSLGKGNQFRQARYSRKGQYSRQGRILSTILLTALLFFSIGLAYLREKATSSKPSEEIQYSPSMVTPFWSNSSDGLPSTGWYTGGIALGDFNNDGKLDLAAGGGGTTWVGDGTGNWTQDSGGLPPLPQVDVTLADFNHDGNLDLAASDIWLGNGGASGSMSWTLDNSPYYGSGVAVGDFNTDGNLDIVRDMNAFAGNGGAGGSLSWADSSYGLNVTASYYGFSLGDVNNDGKPDIVAGGWGVKAWLGNGGSGPAALWIENSTGLPTEGYFAQVALGDVNNDGDLDIAAASQLGIVGEGPRVWTGNGGDGGSMIWELNSTGLDAEGLYWGTSLGDLNDDGNLDLVAAAQSGKIHLWLGNGGKGGSVIWTEDSDDFTDDSYLDVDLGDVNNDGKMDIAATSETGIRVWKNERPDFVITGYTSISNGLPMSLKWADIVFQDVNHDGKLDIGFTRSQDGNEGLRVFLGDGTGNWTNSSDGLSMTGSYNGLRFVDLNHNGNLDLISAGASGPTDGIDVWRGDGKGGWIPEAGPTTDSASGLERGDLNNDGNIDIVTGYHQGNLGPMVFLIDANFGWSPDQGPSASTMDVDDVVIGDVNHDGKLDFAASSMDDVGIQLWTGNGTAIAGSWVRNDTGLPSAGVYLGLAFGDVNHDGNLDLVAAGFGPTQGMYVFTGNGGSGGSMLWEDNSTGLPVSGGYGGVEFCDLNKDGNLDIVFAGNWNGASGIGVRMGNGGEGGTMIWSDPSFLGLPTTGQYWGIACGDVNNDGLPEIGAAKDGGVEVWQPLFQTTPISTPTVNIIVPNGGQDWSGNSDHDIVWSVNDFEDANNLLRIYINYSYDGGSSTGAIAGPIFGGPNPNTYAWTSPFINAIDVTINITIVDTDGNKGYDEKLIPIVDSKSPEVLSTNPFGGQSDVALDEDIIIIFNESMNTSSPESYVTITPDPGGWSWLWSSTTFPDDTLIGSHNGFFQGQFYDVVIGTGARDDSDPGNPLLSQHRWNFTTLEMNNPPSCSVSVPTGAESWTGNAVHVIEWIMTDDFTPQENLTVYLNYSHSGGGGTIVASLSGLIPPFTHAWTLPLIDGADVVVTIDVIDEDGVRGTNTSSEFEIDSTHPTVTFTTPQDGQSNVARNINIEAEWSEGMSKSATNLSFELLENATWLPISGQISWVGDTFAFDPDLDLDGESWYTANFSTQARDDSNPGNSLISTYSWSFRTASAPDLVAPEIRDTEAIPSPQEVYFNVNISANVTDDFAVASVIVNISGSSGASNISMTYDSVSERYYLNRSFSLLGTYQFTIWARDTSGKWNSSSGVFEIEDTTRPTIEDLTIVPSSPEVYQQANISAVVGDNYELFGVKLNISGIGNFSMKYDLVSCRYYDNRTYSDIGPITFWIWANDTSDNWNFSSESFIVEDRTPPVIAHAPPVSGSMASPLLIDVVVTDNVQVASVYLNYTDVSSATFNATMTISDGGNCSYSIPAQYSTGFITYFIWANDSSGNSAQSPFYVLDVIGTRPNPPRNLTVSADKRGTLLLEWHRPTRNEDGSMLTDLGGYNIYRMNESGGSRIRVNVEIIQDTHFLDEGLGDGGTYYYVVRAVNSLGLESEDSNEALGTTMKPSAPNHIWITLVAVTIVLIVTVILLLLLRKRKKEEGEEEPGIVEGESLVVSESDTGKHQGDTVD